MTNTDTINNLKKEITLADTSASTGRQIVANSCKKLYAIIEDGLYEKYGIEATIDAHSDLLKSDFAEPFHCEKNKKKFDVYATIYINKIA